MAGQGRRLVSVGLGLALLFMAVVSVIHQAAGEQFVRGVLAVGPGYSFVSLPCVNTSFTASSFLDALGDAAKSVSYYDSVTQSYVTYDRNLARFGVQVDFPIRPDVGYVVYSSDSCSTPVDGIEAARRSIHLRSGYNLVGWSSPVKSDPVTAFVNPSNGAVQSVSDFNELGQEYMTYDVGLARFGVPQPDFQISQGNAVFVFSAAPCTIQYDETSSTTSPQTTITQTTTTSKPQGTPFEMGAAVVTYSGRVWYGQRGSGSLADYQALKSMGANSVNLLPDWEGLQFGVDTYDWRALDAQLQNIVDAGITRLYLRGPVFTKTPWNHLPQFLRGADEATILSTLVECIRQMALHVETTYPGLVIAYDLGSEIARLYASEGGDYSDAGLDKYLADGYRAIRSVSSAPIGFGTGTAPASLGEARSYVTGWFTHWINAGVPFDFCAITMYAYSNRMGREGDPSIYVPTIVGAAYNLTGRKVYIPEFNVWRDKTHGDAEDYAARLIEYVSMMYQDERIGGFHWWGADTSLDWTQNGWYPPLINPDSTLTPTGVAYETIAASLSPRS